MSQDYSLGPYQAGGNYPLLHRIVADLKPSGTALEFGVSNGSSLKIIAKHMPVVGFDSFAGLPEEWRGYAKGEFASAPPNVANSWLVNGLFADTVPRFPFAAIEPIGLVHIDCDLYSSTKTVLDHLGPHIKPGCYVVLDNYWKFHANGRDPEALAEGIHTLDDSREPDEVDRAWREFADRTRIDWTVIGCTAETWAIQIVTDGSAGV